MISTSWRIASLLLTLLLTWVVEAAWQVPPTGYATMTHYDLPLNDIAACGCTAQSTHYPTVALSQLAYGSTDSYGPACGTCYNLTLLNTFTSDPPFYPTTNPSIVVKVTDECPAISDWCQATADKPNQAGHYLNFDLAYPNPAGAIPSDFFPQNVSLYGYQDFGVWNISYAIVSCTGNWEGANDPAAMGSVTTLGDSVCCPGDVNSTNVCPSYSENSSTNPPDTGTTSPPYLPHLSHNGQIAIAVIVSLIGAVICSMTGYYFWRLWWMESGKFG